MTTTYGKLGYCVGELAFLVCRPFAVVDVFQTAYANHRSTLNSTSCISSPARPRKSRSRWPRCRRSHSSSARVIGGKASGRRTPISYAARARMATSSGSWSRTMRPRKTLPRRRSARRHADSDRSSRASSNFRCVACRRASSSRKALMDAVCSSAPRVVFRRAHRFDGPASERYFVLGRGPRRRTR